DLMVVTNAGVIIRLDVHDISQNGRSAQGVRLMRLGNEQFVSTVAKVKQEDEADVEDENEESTQNDQTGPSNEEVIEGGAPGQAIQTEVTDEEQDNSDNDKRIDVRQDFMDRVNEDIENDSDEDNEEE
ncbi:DNA gyrase C-terminal beta-propeller domain-containing protein, partial [Bacillus sp. JR_15]